MDVLEGIVVGRTDVGESDRVVRLLTPDEGRVDLMAKGARRSRRRFPGALEPGVRLSARRRKGRGSLPLLLAADVLSAPRRAREDYGRLVYLAYGCDVLAALSEQGLAGPKGFRLLEVWLDLLEADPGPDGASRVALEAKALTFAGLTPALVRCPECGEPLQDGITWSEASGGGCHRWCSSGPDLPAEALAAVETLRRTPLAETPGRPVPPMARWLLARFIEYQVAGPLRSKGLVEAEETT